MEIGSDNAKHFIADLWRTLESEACPEKINLVGWYRRHIISRGVPQGTAEEAAIRLERTLHEEVERRSRDWELSGVPRPLSVTDAGGTYVTWRHAQYEPLTGLKPLEARFVEIANWINSLTPRGFLLPCVAVLKSMGASKIFVTDEPGDQGVDIIARLGTGPLRSAALFVQVKTHSSPNSHIGRDGLLLEYGKFLAMPHTSKYQHYREALELDRSVDGTCYCYMFMTNQGFAIPTRQIAANLGILLRSRIQIAHWLVETTTIESLKQIQAVIGLDLKANLAINLAEKINL